MTPTQRTLQQLRREGWQAAVVEKWIPQAKRRLDLFGIGDVLAIRDGETLLVQATSASNHAARRTKALESDVLPLWLAGPGRSFEVWSWSKRGPRGGRKTWEVRRERLTAAERGVETG